MRKLEIGTEKYTQVFATDERGAGNANQMYSVASVKTGDVLQVVCFQNGPIKESGVNGVMNEDLIAMVIDRLQGFQAGKFACRENALAVSCLEEALVWLRERTTGREVRGVEGTHEV
jgi:hypothetical protein